MFVIPLLSAGVDKMIKYVLWILLWLIIKCYLNKHYFKCVFFETHWLLCLSGYCCSPYNQKSFRSLLRQGIVVVYRNKSKWTENWSQLFFLKCSLLLVEWAARTALSLCLLLVLCEKRPGDVLCAWESDLCVVQKQACMKSVCVRRGCGSAC